jgi:hypothetical protein
MTVQTLSRGRGVTAANAHEHELGVLSFARELELVDRAHHSVSGAAEARVSVSGAPVGEVASLQALG